MLCAVRGHQSLNTSICLDSAPFDSPPFPVQLLPKVNVHNPHPRAGISSRKVDSDLNIQPQSENFKQICCLFTQIRDDLAAGRLGHFSKDESFSGLDPTKPKPKYKKPADQSGQANIIRGEYIEQSHANYKLEHALKPLRVGTEQQSKDSPLSSYLQEFAAVSNSNPSIPFPETLYQLTSASPISAPNTGFKRQNHEGPPPAPFQPLPPQTETIDKITTLNSHLYDPGSVDSRRSTPTESLSTPSSPVLQQAHPQLLPDNYNPGRRDSAVSENTVAPSSPRPVLPSQGDAVLISFLAPDQPHIAIKAGESPLPWPSGSDSAAETEMETESGDHDKPGGGDSDNNSRSVSRQSSEGLCGNVNGSSGSGNTTNGGASDGGGGGGGDERKRGSGDGEKEKGNGGSGNGGKDNDKEKEKGKNKKNKDKEQLTPNADAMDIDESSEEKPTNGKHKSKAEQEDTAKDSDVLVGRKDSNAMEVEVSSSETAVSSLMALAGAAGKDQQPFSSGASLPGIFSTTGGRSWAPTAHAQTSPGADRGPPPSPGPSNQLFQNNKLPLPNSPTSLPSIMNASSTSSPNSLPPGGDGRHTTLPPVSSIHVLADIAEKESTHQQSSWGNNTRMPPNSRTVYPTVSSHVSVVSSNRSAQAAQSPGLPPPPQPPHGYGPDGNTRPPMHHMTIQQRQYFLSQDSPSPSSYYPQHQHYQSAYPPIKEGSSNGNSSPYNANFSHGRELPGIMSSPTPTAANFFAQPHNMPSTIGGRRDSTLEPYYSSEHTPPSGPSTGDTMPSSGTEDTVTSPRNRPGMPVGGQQGVPLAAGVFKCEFAGCKAQPFQTQYLLNSHANVHSSARPHYCPVKGCSRAEGGKGFKRKNEMIRHGLVHDSPGYVCPFCPDREHKYPRPDNLQRHVRVHHMDKDKDDPQLRDVLSQRPEGGNRGRRRRLGT